MSKTAPHLRRAVILAAGKSRRLDCLKLDLPKPLIEVAGEPLLAHHLNQCSALGIEEVFINLHYQPEKIRGFVEDGSKWKMKVIYHDETELTGTAGGVRSFFDYLRHEPFLVLYGDNYCAFSLAECFQAHFCRVPRPDMSIILFQLEDVSASGVAVCDENDYIRSFIEKPDPGTTDSHWVNAGVYVMEPHLLEAIPQGSSDFGHNLIPTWLASGKRILGIKTKGRVYAVDTPELYEQIGNMPRAFE